MQDGNFDDHFYNETNRIYKNIISTSNYDDDVGDETMDYEEINSEITIDEIKTAIKNYQTSGKSADRNKFNPVMFKHLGPKAQDSICKLANLCLNEGKWIWDKAEVIFLKKHGKTSYSQPGSYRPISISSYIGKLIEKILAARIYKYLMSLKLHDSNQEGFIPKRNTIRYLNRLINGIKGDIQRKLTTLCILIDFEKAFDSVWKAGLIVKMHKIGIRGKILHLINDFLVNRIVTINVNGVIGKLRQSCEVGLPQGSALSPILFRIYLMDILEDLENNKEVQLFKFADDGTIKVTGDSTTKCLENLQTAIRSVENWVRKNRMIVNCLPDKTEIMCFSTAENDKALIPKTFRLCGNDIKLVKSTKALGLIIDEDLSFIEHGASVHKKLVKKWGTICTYCHRHWGFNQQVMIQIIKTLFHSSMFYAGFIWMNKQSMEEIIKLHYQILKTTIGAVFNLRTSVAHMILGIPPLDLMNKCNLIKHYLKLMLNEGPGDKLKEFVVEDLGKERNKSVLHHQIQQVMKFLLWKITMYPDSVEENDKQKILSKDSSEFVHLKPKSCKYTRPIMNRYMEHLWKNSLQNEYMLEGHSIMPIPSTRNLQIDKNTDRDEEILAMSLLYENNLLNQFLHRYNSAKFNNPLCDCGQEEQTSHHILFNCPLTDLDLRSQAYCHLQKAVGNELARIDSAIILLNASRHPGFMRCVVNIVKSIKHRLRIDIVL